MGVTMMKTSYSPIFNESLDFSCVIFDPQGQMLAQAEFCPSQIGTIKFTVDLDARRARPRRLRTGRRRPAQRSLPRLRPRARAHDAEAGVPRGRALRIRRKRRAHVRARGQDAGRPLRRRDRGLPGRAAAAAGEDQASRRGRRRHLEDHPRQPPHAEGDLRRLPGDDGLARPGRARGCTSCSTTTGSTSSAPPAAS